MSGQNLNIIFSEYVCIKYTFFAHYDIQVIKQS